MRITRKTEKKVRFGELKVGETFIEDDEIFVKCRYEGESLYCPRCDECIVIEDELGDFAVMLSTGELWNFEAHNMVTRIECEVVEI